MRRFLERLKERWGIPTLTRAVIILVVFALTGTTVLVIKPFLFRWLGIDHTQMTLWWTILYVVLILPLYNALLLFYGLIFGQFRFFYEFEKKFFKRIFRKKTESKKRT